MFLGYLWASTHQPKCRLLRFPPSAYFFFSRAQCAKLSSGDCRLRSLLSHRWATKYLREKMHKVKLNLIVSFRYTTPTHEATTQNHPSSQALGLGTQKFPTKQIKRFYLVQSGLIFLSVAHECQKLWRNVLRGVVACFLRPFRRSRPTVNKSSRKAQSLIFRISSYCQLAQITS